MGKPTPELAAPTAVDTFPRRVVELEHSWIPMPDGCRLAARIWLPADAEHDPVPALLEYLPYRKRDATAERDALDHPYLAGHGYACVRVDIRGNGESDGLMLDEYLPSELDDAEVVIAWLRGQRWCSGKVGMMGISWGGFNALQVAARRPAGLDAIVTVCSTDDRYADDIHYKGGCLLGENLGWSTTMLAYSSRPPDPALVGDGWRETWLGRLDAMPILAASWLAHPTRDAFWKHGSVCEDYAAIEAPVLAVGGWGDAYSNAVPRMLAGLRSPVRGIVGPWVHKYPHLAVPGPTIGFLQECLRWWDQWLKGEERGVMDDPLYRAYLMESVRPAASHPWRDGRWVGEDHWPPADAEPLALALDPAGLVLHPGAEKALTVRSPQDCGTAGGEYCAMWLGPEGPVDQRVDDAGSLVFDGAPLAERTEILGAPVVELELAVDRPSALAAVRLCDVWPDGASTRVTFGVLNLSHRDGHEAPTALEPGRRYRVRVRLDDVAWAFLPGHRMRIAVSTAYWPMVWPSPAAATLTLFSGASRLLLPVRAPRDETPADFPRAESAPALEQLTLREAEHARRVVRDQASGETRVVILGDFGEQRIVPLGLDHGERGRETWRIHPDDPTSARAELHWTETLARGDWRVRTEAAALMTCDAEHFHLEHLLEGYEGSERIFQRSWEHCIPRGLL